MPRGGARTRSGPQPAEHSQKKDRAAARAEKERLQGGQQQTQLVNDGDWLTLPRQGRTANPPAWPLQRPVRATPTSKRELVLWRSLWKKPQAMAWEQLGMELQVAFLVRTMVRAEDEDSAIGLLNQVRIQQDGCGLTPAGMNMLHWRIAKAHAAGGASTQDGAVTATVGSPGPSVKSRLKLVTASAG